MAKDKSKEKFIEMYQDTSIPLKVICAYFGFSPQTLNNYVKRFNIPLRQAKKEKISPEQALYLRILNSK